MAGDMATWLVAHSQMHPAFSDLPVMYDMSMGGFEDPTTRNTASRFEALILQLQVCCMVHVHARSAPTDLVIQLRVCCMVHVLIASTDLVIQLQMQIFMTGILLRNGYDKLHLHACCYQDQWHYQ